MIYSSTFYIQSAHFNSRRSYETYWKLACNGVPKEKDLLDAFQDIHGHNYRIVIQVDAEDDDLLDDGWLIDDINLGKLVKQWDNINISTHDDFTVEKKRATTENMSIILAKKLANMFSRGESLSFTVRVYENNDIYAEAAPT